MVRPSITQSIIDANYPEASERAEFAERVAKASEPIPTPIVAQVANHLTIDGTIEAAERAKIRESALAKACERAYHDLVAMAQEKFGAPSSSLVVLFEPEIKAIIYRAYREAKEL